MYNFKPTKATTTNFGDFSWQHIHASANIFTLFSLMFWIFNEISKFEESQNGGFKMAATSILKSHYYVIVTKVSSDTGILSEMLLLKVCGYTFNRDGNIDYFS